MSGGGKAIKCCNLRYCSNVVTPVDSIAGIIGGIIGIIGNIGLGQLEKFWREMQRR
jgi:hypothetical protein